MENRWIQKVKEKNLNTGQIYLWRVGQSGFLVKTEKNLLCLDLYLSPNLMRISESIVKPAEINCADIVFGSHDHPDHIDREAWNILLKASPSAVFVVPKLLQDCICQDLKIPSVRLRGISDMETVSIKGINFTGVASAHEFLDQEPLSGEFPYMGVVIEVEGVKIYQPGDTCLYDGLVEKLRSFGTIDIMVLPINGRDDVRKNKGIVGNLTFQEAADLAGALSPRLVVPSHYDMFYGNLENPQNFVENLNQKFPNQAYWVGEIGEGILVQRKEPNR